MFCSNCGKELDTTDKFCPSCGKKVSEGAESLLAQAEAEQQLATGRLLIVNPETQAKGYVQMTEEKAKAINAESKEDEYYINLIDNWEINAQFKEVSKKLVTVTQKIGGVVLKIGKWVLNLVKDIVQQIRQKLPNTIIGAIVGFAFGLVFSTIPILGWLLGGMVTPLLTIAGGVLGLMSDISDSKIAKQVTAEVFRARGLVAA